jgi:hypothetical protein
MLPSASIVRTTIIQKGTTRRNHEKELQEGTTRRNHEKELQEGTTRQIDR